MIVVFSKNIKILNVSFIQIKNKENKKDELKKWITRKKTKWNKNILYYIFKENHLKEHVN